MPKHKVKVYSTPTCPYCHMVKDYLKEHGVEFEDVNVAEDKDAANEMVEKSGQMGVPVIILDDKIVIVGFDREKLKKALKLKD
ncbi:MAG: glutaredoxin domain-containing protein [Candidatus Woesearchaeota archaeon]